MIRLIIGSIVALLFGSAHAADASGQAVNAGRFDCGGCGIASVLGPLMPLDGIPLAALKSISLVAYTGGTRMVQGDSATLCDGDLCVDVTLINLISQTWQISAKGAYKDTGGKYRNVAPAKSGSGAGSGQTYVISYNVPSYPTSTVIYGSWTIIAGPLTPTAGYSNYGGGFTWGSAFDNGGFDTSPVGGGGGSYNPCPGGCRAY